MGVRARRMAAKIRQKRRARMMAPVYAQRAKMRLRKKISGSMR